MNNRELGPSSQNRKLRPGYDALCYFMNQQLTPEEVEYYFEIIMTNRKKYLIAGGFPLLDYCLSGKRLLKETEAPPGPRVLNGCADIIVPYVYWEMVHETVSEEDFGPLEESFAIIWSDKQKPYTVRPVRGLYEGLQVKTTRHSLRMGMVGQSWGPLRPGWTTVPIIC